MPTIHPTAIIEPGAQLHESCTVGAYAYIGAQVTLGEGCNIMHHATVDGLTTMGESNAVHPYAYIGGKTHDLKYTGGDALLNIGSHNVFREYVTAHSATAAGQATTIGNHNVLLAHAHIAHDCVVGNHNIFSVAATMGGHVTLQDYCNIGWSVGIHQFCHVGSHAMVGAGSKMVKSLPPFMLADGNPAGVRTTNTVGLERRGFSPEEIALVRRLHKTFYRSGLNKSQALKTIAKSEDAESVHAKQFIKFCTQQGERGLA